MNSVYTIVLILATLGGKPEKPKLTLEFAVNPYQKESQVLLSDLKRDKENVSWIEKYYNVKINENPAFGVKTPAWRINKSPWNYWTTHPDFPDGFFKTPGICLRVIKYPLYRTIFNEDNNIIVYLEESRYMYVDKVKPFPKACEVYKVGEEVKPEVLKPFENYDYCIYYYNSEYDHLNILVVDENKNCKIYDNGNLVWDEGKITERSFSYYDPNQTGMLGKAKIIVKQMFIKQIISSAVLKKYGRVVGYSPVIVKKVETGDIPKK